jgi:hypothetical protein
MGKNFLNTLKNPETLFFLKVFIPILIFDAISTIYFIGFKGMGEQNVIPLIFHNLFGVVPGTIIKLVTFDFPVVLIAGNYFGQVSDKFGSKWARPVTLGFVVFWLYEIRMNIISTYHLFV